MFDPVTIINAVAAIENTTGRTSDAIELASQGRDSFVLELAATPNETTDDLLWELRPTLFGASTFLTTPLQLVVNGTTDGPVMVPLLGTIDNPGTDGATYQFEFSNLHANAFQLWVASSETNSTYTVTAKIRTLKYGP